MKTFLYQIDCLTNLHVGSGDVNFNIVDKEVERDPVTGYPMIHASGVKGAIRDYCVEKKVPQTDINTIFGAPGGAQSAGADGDFKFLDAYMLYRTMRASGSKPSVYVTTEEALKHYDNDITQFNCKPQNYQAPVYNFNFGNDAFVSSVADMKVEGENTKHDPQLALDIVLGTKEYAVAKTMEPYDLPVVARNNLDPNKRNLWYEEFVPYGTRFFFFVLTPDKYTVTDVERIVPDGSIIQFGGNASIGCGYCKVSRLAEGSI